MNRKLRKLINHPVLFFSDALKKRIEKYRTSSFTRRIVRKGEKTKFSLIIAIKSDNSNIFRLLNTLSKQPTHFQSSIELVFVCGQISFDFERRLLRMVRRCTNSSVQLATVSEEGWPYARKLGVERARGQWLAFVDPDDCVDARYIAEVDGLLSRHAKSEVRIIACNIHSLDASTGKKSNSYPVRAAFGKGTRVVAAATLTNEILGTGTGSFIHKDALKRCVEALACPWHEDLSSIAILCEAVKSMGPKESVGLAAKAIYYKVNTDSRHTTTNGTGFDFALETRAVRDLLVNCLNGVEIKRDARALWLQRQLAHVVLRRVIGPLLNKDELSAGYPTSEFLSVLKDLFSNIELSAVQSIRQGGVNERLISGALATFKNMNDRVSFVDFTEFNNVKSLLLARYFCANPCVHEFFAFGGGDTIPAYSKYVTHSFLGAPFVYERLVWLPIVPARETVEVMLNGARTSLGIRGRAQPNVLTTNVIVASLSGQLPLQRKLPLHARRLLTRANAAKPAERFGNAWIFMDRSDRADDNAEHLFRYVVEFASEINAFFVVSKGADYDRLKKAGYCVLEFGSIEHKIALIHAQYILSSHAASFAYSYLPKKDFGNLLAHKFVFLQHGVTLGDLSRHFNGKSVIDLFITSSPAEHNSIAGEISPYDMAGNRVALTGFARHDELLRRARSDSAKKKIILFAPTWRRYLVSPVIGRSAKREAIDGFFESEYAMKWFGLLSSKEFQRRVSQAGYSVKLFLHPAMEPYRADLRRMLPQIDLYDPTVPGAGSIQDLFIEASLMVTDYSSVAFEMAVIERPVLYYQFDAFEFLESGAHTTVKGYFEFERDGFGPVCYNETNFISALDDILRDDCKPSPIYLDRMRKTFAHSDGRNCERILAAVRNIEERSLRDCRSRANLVHFAETASREGDWAIALNRWTRIMALPEAEQPISTRLRIAEALARLGRYDEVLNALESVPIGERSSLEWRLISAEVCERLEKWQEAIEYLAAMEVSVDPHFDAAQVLRRLVEANSRLGNEDEVLRLAEQFSDQVDVPAPVHAVRGRQAMAADQLDNAIEHFDLAISEGTVHEQLTGDILCLKARCMVSLGNGREALKFLVKFMKLYPNLDEVRYLAGQLALELGEEKLVIDCWVPLVKRSVVLSPGEVATCARFVRMKRNAAVALGLLNGWVATYEGWDASVELERIHAAYDASDFSSTVCHADAYLAHGEALDREKALELQGRALVALGRMNEAVSVLQRAYGAANKNQSIGLALGNAAYLTRNYELAVATLGEVRASFRPLIDNDVEHAEMIRKLAASLLMLDRLDELQLLLNQEAALAHIGMSASEGGIRVEALTTANSLICKLAGQEDGVTPWSMGRAKLMASVRSAGVVETRQ